jgi:hypothetical protein
VQETYCAAGFEHTSCPLWVIKRRTRIEHILSALPALATKERTFGIGSSVPEAAVSNRSKQTSYSITSSARCSRNQGKLSSSFFAVATLMTSRYLVASSIGRSAGLPPLRILSM